MTTTENLGLNLPGKSDYVDIEKINENFQTLDVHTHTMESLGAAPADHNHDGTYSKQGHTHTAKDIGAADASHHHDAAQITSGVFSATNIKAKTGTDYTYERLRNASLNAAETTPTENGAIAWTYE